MKKTETAPLAVKITGLSKSYGSNRVLENLDVNVPKGAVYGFL